MSKTHSNTISMFATANPTDKWVVAIDGFFCFAATKSCAQAIYDLAMSGSDGYIENTPFGAIDIVPPHHVPTYIDGYQPAGGLVDVTTRRPTNLIGYINKSKSRRHYPGDPLTRSATADRLRDAKDMASLFGMGWREYLRTA